MEIIENWLTRTRDYAVANLLPTLLVAIIGAVIIAIIRHIVKRILKKSRMETAAHSLINSVVSIALYLLLGLIVASGLGIDVTGVVALTSVLTLAVSLAVQNMLTNIIGGFTLLNTSPFSSGDFVEIAGQSGTVKEIGLTYTKLATTDNKEVSIPNSAVVAAQIVNYTVTGTRRVEIYVSASYDCPIPKVLEALEAAGQHPKVLTEKGITPSVKGYGESAIDYQLFVWAKTEDVWTVKCEILASLKGIFDEKGVELTYPHVNVHLEK